MFKKTNLALAAILVTAATSSFSQSTATVYGRFDTALVMQNSTTAGVSTSTRTIGSGAWSGSRFGFRGAEDMGGGTKAIFTLEGGFNPATGASGQGGLTFGRQAYMGLSGGFGQVTMGRQYNPSFEHHGDFDPMNGISNVDESSFYLGYTGARVNNSVRYGNSFGGVNVAAMYGFGGVANATGRNAYTGLRASYGTGPLNIGAAYQSSEAGGTTAAAGVKTNATNVGANYGFGPARVFFNFQSASVSNAVKAGDSKTTTLGLNYDFTGSTSLYSAYYRDKANKVAVANTGTRSTVAVGVIHNLSKRTNVYGYIDRSSQDAAYAGTNGDIGADSRRNIYFGARHSF